MKWIVFHDLQLLLFVFFPWSSIAFACFSKSFIKGQYENLPGSISLLWSEDGISSAVGYFY